MEDPPGSPTIKAEPQDNPDGAPPFNTGEIINLISDDEDEATAPANVRTLGSPFQEQPHESDAVNLGRSLLFTKPKPAKPSESDKDAQKAKNERIQAMIAAKQRETTEKHRMPARPVQRTPLVGRSDLFVTESNPGTPDPAEVFRAVQRDFEEKRQNGSLTWQEEIEFERAQATEKARVLKERLDQAYDGSDDAVSVGEDLRMSPSVASLPEDDDGEPEKRGRKRKADPISKPQPKKRRAAPKSAEDILATARRKIEAKAKAKAAGKRKSQAPKKGRKTKSTVPDLLNTTGILGNNVFEDAARMRDVPDQPIFGSDHDKRKDKALKSLIASVPEEYRPVAKTDKKYLEDAMKDFTGRGAVTPADDGNWHVKGVRISLKHYQVQLLHLSISDPSLTRLQVLGVAFMRCRECSSIDPKGGILADSMQVLTHVLILEPPLTQSQGFGQDDHDVDEHCQRQVPAEEQVPNDTHCGKRCLGISMATRDYREGVYRQGKCPWNWTR